MKRILILVFSLLIFNAAQSQSEDTIKMVKNGDLFEVHIYYDNGTLMQHGYLNKENHLQGTWVSYYEDGTKKCVALYDNGMKTGVWLYYYKDFTKKVTYRDNKIISVEDIKSIE